MTTVPLSAALAGFALAALAAVIVPRGPRPVVVGTLTALAGALTVTAGISATAGHGMVARLPELLPPFGIRVELDALSGLFVAVGGAVTVCVAVYGIGYTRHGSAGRAGQALLPLFVAAMTLVAVAGSVATFLVAWELMAVCSLLLVLAEHRVRAEVRAAGWWYAVSTHAGFALICLGLLVLAATAGSGDFDVLRERVPSGAVATTVFCLTGLGFASKAGAVPLHVWLPRAHPEAPSHVSALMSAAMVNLGIYGLLRVGVDLLGGGPGWWWLTVLGLGVVSAGYGVLQAVVSRDLKRLLAYSTTENLGLVLIGVGIAGFLLSHRQPALAALALLAALLHLVNHAGFKTLLFGAAGSVLHGTGSRDLDALGGLTSRMPVTTGLFGLGALSAAALPPGNAFVSEWLLLQSLLQTLPAGGVAAAVAIPLAVGVLALSAGLAVAAFVKAFGVGFLAKPRTPGAARAVESPPSMLVGMTLAGICCVALALAPALLLPALSDAVAVLVPEPAAVAASAGELATGTGRISPIVLTVGLVLTAVILATVLRGRRARRTARLWDCGGGPLTARTEYTATSFAQPLQRVFDDVLAPETDVDVTHVRESRYLVDRITVTSRVADRWETAWYHPVIRAGLRCGRAATRLATGSVHQYLAYGFAAVLVLLVAVAVIG